MYVGGEGNGIRAVACVLTDTESQPVDDICIGSECILLSTLVEVGAHRQMVLVT